MKKILKKLIDYNNKIYHHAVIFYFAILPAFGLFMLSVLIVNLGADFFTIIDSYHRLIFVLFYIILTIFTAQISGSKFFRRNFLISSGILIIAYIFGITILN